MRIPWRAGRGFATGSAARRQTIEAPGATLIDRDEAVDDDGARLTSVEGFEQIFDTAGGVALSASSGAVRQFGHVANCLGRGTHALAPPSCKGASDSGVFTLAPLLSGRGRASFIALHLAN